MKMESSLCRRPMLKKSFPWSKGMAMGGKNREGHATEIFPTVIPWMTPTTSAPGLKPSLQKWTISSFGNGDRDTDISSSVTRLSKERTMFRTPFSVFRSLFVLVVGITFLEPITQAAANEDIDAVKATIHETAERWNSQDFSSVLGLWDLNEEVPFYLAEEQDDWFIGWEPLRAYLDPPHPSPVVEAIREEMSDISVKLIAEDLAIAAWHMHFEMKMRGKEPIGEDVRVSAVFRKTDAGWRYIHWAESPMTALAYMDRLFQQDVDHEKLDVMLERSRARRDARD
ncbi:MAG: hypothetical protein GKS03_01180 [Alphaproteobacteria bacterium]|nr:hypothetical protein [Alphaproteobacteria bacterium]